MSDRCPDCGAFVGKCGCTNPKHPHSAATSDLLGREKPEKVTVAECEAALKEGFYVEDRDGNRVGFGRPLLAHIDRHHASAADRKDRKEHLLFAVDAVRDCDTFAVVERKGEARPVYFKRFGGGGEGVVAVCAPEGSEDAGCLHYVFSIHRDRDRKKKSRGAWPAGSWHLRAAPPSRTCAETSRRGFAEVRDAAGLTVSGRTALPFRCGR